MSDVLSRLKQKEQKLTELRQKEERRQGQRDQLILQLKQEFGLETLDSAQAKLTEINQQVGTVESKLEALDAEMAGILEKAQKKG